MAKKLVLDQIIDGQPGDEFIFQSTSGSIFQTQYHFEVSEDNPDLIIGIWGPNNPKLGKARNKQGQTFVDRTLPKGSYKVTVQNVTGPYKITVTKNSFGKKIFGID